jgi:hypothetical protein
MAFDPADEPLAIVVDLDLGRFSLPFLFVH